VLGHAVAGMRHVQPGRAGPEARRGRGRADHLRRLAAIIRVGRRVSLGFPRRPRSACQFTKTAGSLKAQVKVNPRDRTRLSASAWPRLAGVEALEGYLIEDGPEPLVEEARRLRRLGRDE
jgi:hypothetical protein